VDLGASRSQSQRFQPTLGGITDDAPEPNPDGLIPAKVANSAYDLSRSISVVPGGAAVNAEGEVAVTRQRASLSGDPQRGAPSSTSPEN
jgi:hypothetical protein